MIAEHFTEKAVEISLSEVRKVDLLSQIFHVTRVSVDEEKVTLYTQDVLVVFADLNRLAEKDELSLRNVVVREATLEDAFLKLTGRRIRD